MNAARRKESSGNTKPASNRVHWIHRIFGFSPPADELILFSLSKKKIDTLVGRRCVLCVWPATKYVVLQILCSFFYRFASHRMFVSISFNSRPVDICTVPSSNYHNLFGAWHFFFLSLYGFVILAKESLTVKIVLFQFGNATHSVVRDWCIYTYTFFFFGCVVWMQAADCHKRNAFFLLLLFGCDQNTTGTDVLNK